MNDRPELERDLAALRKVSAKELPDLETTIRMARQRVPDSGPWHWKIRREIMALLHSIRTRPVRSQCFHALNPMPNIRHAPRRSIKPGGGKPSGS